MADNQRNTGKGSGKSLHKEDLMGGECGRNSKFGNEGGET